MSTQKTRYDPDLDRSRRCAHNVPMTKRPAFHEGEPDMIVIVIDRERGITGSEGSRWDVSCTERIDAMVWEDNGEENHEEK